MSHRDISENEIKLLEKGLKFTPTTKRDNEDLIKDTEELRLRECFQNEENEDE